MSNAPRRHSPFVQRAAADASLALDQGAVLPRAGEIVLTAGQKQALLTLRKTDVCQTVIDKLRETGQLVVHGRDYYALARAGLAINKGSFHVIAPHARWKADQVAKLLARELKLHVITYDLGAPNRAAFTRCCCGWVAYRSRSIPSYALMMGRDAHHHLQFVKDAKAPAKLAARWKRHEDHAA